MAQESNASFIPKRNPGKNLKRAVTRRVYLLTFLSYVALFLAIILAAALFGYKYYLNNQLTERVQQLKIETDSFDGAKMEAVVDRHRRIKMVEAILEKNVSLSNLLEVIDDHTAVTIQYEDVTIERKDVDTVALNAKIVTDNLDSAIFQRGVYNDDIEEIAGVQITDITFEVGGSANSNSGLSGRQANAKFQQIVDSGEEPSVTMTAIFSLDNELIGYEPVNDQFQGLQQNQEENLEVIEDDNQEDII
ncbi:hypothetical protein KC723_02055 [Candidatus Kaiserbacteria bacterium]|nr:hypothetical protein [Candidatus Kaiserbacteria bacterium]